LLPPGLDPLQPPPLALLLLGSLLQVTVNRQAHNPTPSLSPHQLHLPPLHRWVQPPPGRIHHRRAPCSTPRAPRSALI